MPKYYFEDFHSGEVALSPPKLVTREEIIAFVRIRSAADASRRGGGARLDAGRARSVGLAHLRDPDAHDLRLVHPRFRLDGRARRRRGQLAQAGTAGRHAHAAPYGRRDAHVEEPAGGGLRALQLRTAQSNGRTGDDADGAGDARPAERQAGTAKDAARARG